MTKTKDRLFHSRNPRLWRGPVDGVNRARERLALRRRALPQDLRRTINAIVDHALDRLLTGYASLALVPNNVLQPPELEPPQDSNNKGEAQP